MKSNSEGYVVIALNNSITDYIQCARVLAKSLRSVGDIRPITLITDTKNRDNLDIFDSVVTIESNDVSDWRLSDDWRVYHSSPYERTFKIESDVIITRPLDNWWELCRERDILVATGTRDYHNVLSPSRYYRRTIDSNGLPDVYNGITYFRRSRFAQKFFKTVRTVFENWQEINQSLASPSSSVTADTDTVYAIVCQLLGPELTTLPNSPIQWIHMKSRINGTIENWTQELCWELVGHDFRINTISQMYPVHYHIKDLAEKLEKIYDNRRDKK